MIKINKPSNLEWLYEQCAYGNPHISINLTLQGNVPHVEGTNISVSNILARLYIHGSLQKVVKYYDDITEEQIKDAIAYAARFMEIACNPPQNADAD